MSEALVKSGKRTGIIPKRLKAEELRKKRQRAKKLAQKKARARTLARQHAKAERLAILSVMLSDSIEKERRVAGHLFSLMETLTGAAESLRQQTSEISETTKSERQVAETLARLTVKYHDEIVRVKDGAMVAQEAFDRLAKCVELSTRTALETAQTVRNLRESAPNIGEVVQVVKKIADQMNILALNAATEASLAGDYGRGFSVIADELKVYAEAMESAAQQIREVAASFQFHLERVLENADLLETLFTLKKHETDLIGKRCRRITDQLGHIDDLVSEMRRKPNYVLSAAESMEEKMTETAEATRKMSDLTEAITSACREQRKALSEVSETIQRLAEVPDKLKDPKNITGLSGEIAASAEELSATVDELHNTSVEVVRAMGDMRAWHVEIRESVEGIEKVSESAAETLDKIKKQWEYIYKQHGTRVLESIREIKTMDYSLFLSDLKQLFHDYMTFFRPPDPEECQHGKLVKDYKSANKEGYQPIEKITGLHSVIDAGACEVTELKKADTGKKATRVLSEKNSSSKFPQLFTDTGGGFQVLRETFKFSLCANEKLAQSLSILDKECNKILRILDSVSSVAMQTNMLAVYGKIEAEQAGEYATALGAVSGDIRSFASESIENTWKMKEILEEIQEQTRYALHELFKISIMTQNHSQTAGAAISALEPVFDLLGDGTGIKRGGRDCAAEAIKVLKKVNQTLKISQKTLAKAMKVAQEAARTANEQIKGLQEIAITSGQTTSVSAEMENI